MARIEIVTDGGSYHGVGHVRRSLTLAAELRRQGAEANVLPSSEEAAELLEAPVRPRGTPDVAVIDLPYPGDEWLTAYRKADTKVVGLDYEGEQPPDLVVSVFDRGTAPVSAPHLFGLQFALVRPDVTTLAPAGPGAGVLVVMGGADVRRFGARTAADLAGRGEPVVLVVGPRSQPPAEPTPYEVLWSPADLPTRMAGCGWAVSNGGGTMLELMCLGKAVHVVPQTDAERRLALLVHEQGGLLGVGPPPSTPPDGPTRDAVGRRARALVDGAGASRIADLILAGP